MKKEIKCEDCKYFSDKKVDRSDESSYRICKKTGKQVYNQDIFEKAPKNCPLRK